MIVHGQSATCVALACSPFYFYVRSSANVADLPSRLAIADLVRVLRRVEPRAVIETVDPVMPDLRSWRMAAREWMRMLGMHEPRGPSLGALRGEWRHLVTDVRNPWWRVGGAVYVGRTPRFGPTTYGNRAYTIAPSSGMSRTRLRNEHERAVRAYAVWIGQPAQRAFRARIRSRLKGRPLACHCSERGLSCHAEIIAVVANAWPPESVLQCAECA